jgi:ferrous iron transport protein B
VTILVAPLMSCSARLPVYTLLIAACIPNITVLGFFKLTGLTMLAMYLLGIVVALLMAWLFKKTLLKGETPMLIMELPPYKRPLARVVVRHMWDRSKIFLRRAGTVILGINIILWFLATYPKSQAIEKNYHDKMEASFQKAYPRTDPKIMDDIVNGRSHVMIAINTPDQAEREKVFHEEYDSLSKRLAGEKLRNSFAGKMGRAIEPIIAPLGFDWKMGIGIISSFAAREVFVSTMSTVYNVGSSEDEGSKKQLVETLKRQKHPDGTTIYTPLLAVTLMVFYVFAMQCASTVAIVRRETNTWKWPLFQWAYMGALAWGLAFITLHVGRWLGWG